MGCKKKNGSTTHKEYNFDPMAVTWLENYNEWITKIWNRVPRNLGKCIATLAVFMLGISINGDWLNLYVHIMRQFGYVTYSNPNVTHSWYEISIHSLKLQNFWIFWLGSCAVSYLMYFLIGGFLHWYYYIRQRDRAEEWKCQPKKWLSPELERHEIILGSTTLFLNATTSALLACYIANGGYNKIYYHISDSGWIWFFLQFAVIFLYQATTNSVSDFSPANIKNAKVSFVDKPSLVRLCCIENTVHGFIDVLPEQIPLTEFICGPVNSHFDDYCTYWLHRIYHFPFLYKRFHKLHHKYKQPTAFSVTAIHPLESLHIQLTLILPIFVVPIHWFPFYTVALYTYYHGIIDHSGINFKAYWWQPWQPDAIFHDNHHQYFHVNFAFNIELWDKIHGTYRRKDRVYREDIFYGKGKSIDKLSISELREDVKERDSENPLAYRGNKLEYQLSSNELKKFGMK